MLGRVNSVYLEARPHLLRRDSRYDRIFSSFGIARHTASSEQTRSVHGQQSGYSDCVCPVDRPRTRWFRWLEASTAVQN
jgi:hypothetical protein